MFTAKQKLDASPAQFEPQIILENGFESGSLAPAVGFNAKAVDTPSFSGLFSAKLAANGLNSYIFQTFVPNYSGGVTFSTRLLKADQRPSPPIVITIYQNIPPINGIPGFVNGLFFQFLPSGTLPFGDWFSVFGSLPQPIGRDTLPIAYLVINALPLEGTSPVFVDDIQIADFMG